MTGTPADCTCWWGVHRKIGGGTTWDIAKFDPDCPEHGDPVECPGHPAGPFDPMGQTVYCDGRCVS